MLGASGQPRPELFVEDQLHMNARGYAIWTRILRPVVEREFKAAGTEVPAHESSPPTARLPHSHHFDRCDRGRPGWSP